MNEFERTIVSFAKGSGRPVSSAEIAAVLEEAGMSVSAATLARRIEGLVEQRHLAVEGRARSTRYRWDNYHDYFAVPPDRRPKVSYDASRLASYRPNETTWLMESEKKSMVDAGGGPRLDASTYSNVIAQKLLVDLSYGSSLLEGNTYTYLDTQVLIEFGQQAQGKDRDETVMILNHKAAITHLIDAVPDIHPDTREIKTLHALLSQGLSNMDPRDVGAVRRMPVDHIGGSAYLPMAIPQRLEEEMGEISRKAIEIRDPFEQSLFLMAYVSYLQAFRDVNKRTARLACNIPLLRNGLAPLSFMDMDKGAYVRGLLSFYEMGRVDVLKDAYVGAYLQSARRYEAYYGRPRVVLDVEFRRRADIHACVGGYVSSKVDRSFGGTPEEYAAATFEGEDEKDLLVDRVVEIVEALGPGNHVAYGIPRKTFDAYEVGARIPLPTPKP